MRFKQMQKWFHLSTILLSIFLISFVVNNYSWNDFKEDNFGLSLVNSQFDYLTKEMRMDLTNTERKKEYKPIANLDDIKAASSEAFPFAHELVNGLEWIDGSIEEYLVLKYQQPLLSSGDIKGIQEILTLLNLYSGAIDGVYGPNTQEAVVKFQQQYGITPSGIMDLDDYHLLASVFDEQAITTTGQVKPEGTVSILIILDERTLYVLEDGKEFYKFPIAIGMVDTPSPIGNWKIISKDNWGDGFGTRWLGLNVPYGKFGIHGTNKPWSIGSNESHGCFRMYNRDIEILYNWVTWGTRVYVVGGNFPYNIPWRVIDDGDRGSDVWVLQNRLRELGYYKSRPDGVFGWGTKNAVIRFQKDQGIGADGKVSWNTLDRLGLYLFQ